MNDMTYSQFCLEQLQLKTWQFSATQFGLIQNSQNQVVGHLVLAYTPNCQAEAQVTELIDAMLKAIALRVEPLQYAMPEKSESVQFLLQMGEIKGAEKWQNCYKNYYKIHHPAEMLQNPQLKKVAWKVLQTITSSV